MMRHRTRTAGIGALLPVLLAGTATSVAAQEERFPGVELGLVYETAPTPVMGIQPFRGEFGGFAAAEAVERIIANDLGLSDRFDMLDSVPAALVGEDVDYQLWDGLGATWLLEGSVEGRGGGGYVLVLTVHDVPFARATESGRFAIPEPGSEGFRMAVHRVSDQVVRWIFDEPGMAASRIIFHRTDEDGTQDLWIVDADGENLRQLTGHEAIVMSPAWHPAGDRVIFLSDRDRPFDLFERNLRTGEERKIAIDRDGQLMTPIYAPDGERIVFAVGAGRFSGLYEYNLARDCCLENLTIGRWSDFSPSFAPDGDRLVFNSTRLGAAIPQIYVADEDGDGADLVSPYAYGRSGQYGSPDWAPLGDRIAFHGKVGRVGRFHILIADMQEAGRLLQLSQQGNNEDPSWAPDGRHLVYGGERSWGKGMFIVDAVTGTTRTVLRGVDVTTPTWSPSLR